jgi:hypothetical protein
MANDASRSLLCLIEGESTVFKVKPAGSDDIIALKKLIKEKGKNGVFKSVDANILILWKVRITMANDGTTNSPAG